MPPNRSAAAPDAAPDDVTAPGRAGADAVHLGDAAREVERAFDATLMRRVAEELRALEERVERRATELRSCVAELVNARYPALPQLEVPGAEERARTFDARSLGELLFARAVRLTREIHRVQWDADHVFAPSSSTVMRHDLTFEEASERVAHAVTVEMQRRVHVQQQLRARRATPA